MKPTTLYAAIFSFATFVWGSPTALNKLVARKDRSHLICTQNDEGKAPKGNLLCIDSTGATQDCKTCFAHRSTKNGYECFITTGGGGLGKRTACPGDPAPKKYPNGKDVKGKVAKGIVGAFCDVAGADGAFGWFSFAGCYAWTYYSTTDESIAKQEMTAAEGK